MSHQADIFTPEELRQFALDRKRQALTAFLASGFPTSPRHEDMLNQSTTPLKSAQIGESSQPRQRLAQYNDGNDRNTQGVWLGRLLLAFKILMNTAEHSRNDHVAHWGKSQDMFANLQVLDRSNR
jgi:hypothetical protein